METMYATALSGRVAPVQALCGCGDVPGVERPGCRGGGRWRAPTQGAVQGMGLHRMAAMVQSTQSLRRTRRPATIGAASAVVVTGERGQPAVPVSPSPSPSVEFTYSIPALFPDHEGGVALRGPAQAGALVPVEIPTGYDGTRWAPPGRP
jgi:hypothetical protein